MDDLVVIILTLIIFAVGAIGQIKKKKQIPVAPEEQNNQADIWDLFRQEPIVPAVKTRPEYIIAEQEESGPFENEQGYKFEAKNEGEKLIGNEIKPEAAIKDSLTEKKEKFSLRKAVIYSEILNRKYI